jgi:hypothetical protein
MATDHLKIHPISATVCAKIGAEIALRTVHENDSGADKFQTTGVNRNSAPLTQMPGRGKHRRSFP